MMRIGDDAPDRREAVGAARQCEARLEIANLGLESCDLGIRNIGRIGDNKVKVAGDAGQ